MKAAKGDTTAAACVGKERFETMTLAQKVAARPRRGAYTLAPYRCAACKGFHLGNPMIKTPKNGKRKEGPRTPSGQLSRSAAAREWITTNTEKDAMETVVAARKRLFGLSEKDTKEGYAGSVVGRLRLAKVIRRDQYDAAIKYLEVRNAYQRAIGAVPDFTQPPEPVSRYDGPPLSPEKAWAAFCRRAKDAHEAMMRVLQGLMASERSPAPVAALDAILVKDCHEPSLVGPLRSALNALGKHFGMQVVQEAQEAA